MGAAHGRRKKSEEVFNKIVYDAAGSGRVDQLQAALQTHGHLIDAPYPNYWGQTPLHHAAMYGHVEVIEALIRLGSKSLDTPDNNGMTPMHRASRHLHADVIKALARLGSRSIDTPDNEGRTPMHLAAGNGHVEIIEVLVRLGSLSLDSPDNLGMAPIHYAAMIGHVDVIEAVVRLGSRSLDCINKSGMTPIYHAAQQGVLKDFQQASACAKLLMALGSNPNIPTEELSTEMVQQLRTPLDESEVAEIRFRVFFSSSLVHRLLCALTMR